MLIASGWIIQNYKSIDFSVGRGIAVREVPLKTGPCDYLLLVDRKPVGVVEAKRQGTKLSTVAEQSGRYASSLSDFLAAGLSGPLPFLYESTGVETFFRDERDPEPRSRMVFSFHRPETLAEWLTESDSIFTQDKFADTICNSFRLQRIGHFASGGGRIRNVSIANAKFWMVAMGVGKKN